MLLILFASEQENEGQKLWLQEPSIIKVKTLNFKGVK